MFRPETSRASYRGTSYRWGAHCLKAFETAEFAFPEGPDGEGKLELEWREFRGDEYWLIYEQYRVWDAAESSQGHDYRKEPIATREERRIEPDELS